MPSSNPLWFGYYPGDRPVYKRPGPVPPFPQLDLSSMGLDAALNEAIRVTEIPAEMPNQIWEWLMDDWKQKFAVTAVGYEQTGGGILEYDPQEGADVAGVNPAVNLQNLVVNPRKALGKMWGTMFNPLNPLSGEFWTDLDTSTERDLWRRLVGMDRSGTRPLFYNLVEKAFADSGGNALNLIDQKVYKEGKSWTLGLDRGSLKTVEKNVAENTDVYKELAENIMGFVAGRKSVIQRNPAFTSMQNSFIRAAATELKQRKTAINTAITAGSGGATLAAAVRDRISDFLLEADVAEALGGFSKGIKSFNDVVSKSGMKAPVGKTIAVGNIFNAADDTKDLGKSIRALRDSIDKAKGATGAGIADVVKREAFNRDIKGIEDILARAETFRGKIKGKGSSWNPSNLEASAVLSEMNLIKDSLTNFRYGAGAQGSYLLSVSRRHLRGPDSLLKTMTDPSSGTGSLMSQGYRSLGALCPYMEQYYMYEDGRDLINTITKGNLPKVILWWGKMSPRIQHFTPSYWTGKLMDSTHKFGLIYDDDWENKELFSFFKAGKNPLIRENKFKLSFTPRGGAAVSELKVVGGKYLGAARDAWNLCKENNLVGFSAGTGVVTPGGTPAQQTQALFDLINGKEADFLRANIDLDFVRAFGKDMAEAQKKFANFKTFLTDNAGHLGLTMDPLDPDNIANTVQNKAILDGFFSALKKRGPGTINPTSHYYGPLEWVSAKLTGVQQGVFSKIGKFVSPFIRLKNAAAKVITDATAKLISNILLKVGITAALGAASGGLATFLAPLLEKVVQAVMSKVTDNFKRMLKAVLKGDVVGEFNRMMDDAMKMMEKVITCGCFVPVFLVIAVLMLAGGIIGSISPISVIGNIIDSANPAMPPSLPPTAINNCVLKAYSRTCLSYSGANVPVTGQGRAGTWRHGSNDYWSPKDDASGVHGMKDCDFKIPSLGGGGADGPTDNTGSWCSTGPSSWLDPWRLQSYYGWALDVAPPECAGGVETCPTVVYMPKLSDIVSWRVVRGGCDGKSGCSIILTGRDSTNTEYKIYLLHLDEGSLDRWCGLLACSKYPGDPIANLFKYPLGWHVHIEMQVTGNYVKPEEHMCTTGL